MKLKLLISAFKRTRALNLLSTRCLSKTTCNTTKFNVSNRYEVHVIPALSDNYMYVMTDKLLQTAIAVDPVEPAKIFNVLEHEKVSLKAVLTTHHHLDHAGGNKEIAQIMENIPIYGGDDRIKAMTNKLFHNETMNFGALIFKCLYTPCHTSGHVCYYTETANLGPVCFTGDTLFVAGCGRFFEGTAIQMLQSLNILSSLPLNTRVYCGHEYTINNLKFALNVEPDNHSIHEKLKTVENKLKKGEFSVPTTIGEELSYNPFLRTSEESVRKFTKQIDPIAVMEVLREKKDKF